MEKASYLYSPPSSDNGRAEVKKTQIKLHENLKCTRLRNTVDGTNRKLAVRGEVNEREDIAMKPFTMKHTEEQEHPMKGITGLGVSF